MNYNEALKLLESKGQSHLLKYYDELNDAEKQSLLSQIENIDFDVIDLCNNPTAETAKGELKPLGALTIDDINKNKDEYKKIGLEAVKAGKVAAVLLAGGQGTRLGFDGPKGTYNVGITKELYIFEMQIRNLMEVVKQAQTWVPLFIMTSDKNNDATVEFFKKHGFFGYNPEYVTFFKQDMAPSVSYDKKIYLEGKGKISLSPNGNGGWYVSLKKSGALKKAQDMGVEWFNIYAVDNVLQKSADPVFVGATISSGCSCGAKVVAKADPNERVGVLCLEDGKPSIVEYYEMTDEIINSREPDGRLSYNYGVILNYIFRIDVLEEIVSRHLPTHVVEKKIPYIDENANPVKPDKPNGYKFELLVLDMIHLFPDCCSFEVEREKEFAPIKNKDGVDSVESARKLLKLNGIEL